VGNEDNSFNLLIKDGPKMDCFRKSVTLVYDDIQMCFLHETILFFDYCRPEIFLSF